MKSRVTYEAQFPGSKTKQSLKLAIPALDAAIMIAGPVNAFKSFVNGRYPEGQRPKLKKITITVTLP